MATVKAIKIDLPRYFKEIEIHTFADLHIGDKFCDKDLIKQRIEYVKNKDNAYLILNGDIINNATKTSISDCYAEELSPMEQIQTALNYFESVKDKILAITSGNHENRSYNKEGIDIMRIVAQQMKLIDRYSKTSAMLFIRVGEDKRGHGREIKGQQCYTVYVTHGSGGGRKEGAKAIRLADMASVIDADIYIHSHTHLPMVMKQSFHRTDIRNSTYQVVDKLFVNTSAALNYGGYGEAFEYKPSSKDTPIIYLSGTHKSMIARL